MYLRVIARLTQRHCNVDYDAVKVEYHRKVQNADNGHCAMVYRFIEEIKAMVKYIWTAVRFKEPNFDYKIDSDSLPMHANIFENEDEVRDDESDSDNVSLLSNISDLEDLPQR